MLEVLLVQQNLVLGCIHQIQKLSIDLIILQMRTISSFTVLKSILLALIISFMLYLLLIVMPRVSKQLYVEFYRFEGEFLINSVSRQKTETILNSDLGKFYFRSSDKNGKNKLKKGQLLSKFKNERYFVVEDLNTGEIFKIVFDVEIP